MKLDFADLLVFSICFAVCQILVWNQKTIGKQRSVRSMRQKQALHSIPVPRLGGVAIFSSVLVTTLFVSPQLTEAYAMFVIALIPLVAAGVYEDMVRPIVARWRLSAIALSCLFVIAALEVWLPRTGIAVLDPWMAGPVGLALTVLVVTGITNAFNMIDGLNGLSAGVSFCAFGAIAAISVQIGFGNMIHLSMMYVFAIAAFLIFNFPLGRLYLGDSGAYLLGFILAWFSISVLLKSDTVSPWAFFLIFSYPILEMLISIFRRVLQNRSAFSADTEHFHHLVFRKVQSSHFLRHHAKWHNPLTTLVIVPFAVLPMFLGVVFFDNAAYLLVSSLCVSMGYVVSYLLLRRYDIQTVPA
jgi:UDP-GlcNAc:undecaprenyl-phosphate/decaprenyl-phosphate GlcNAc-1-phosphate transferase